MAMIDSDKYNRTVNLHCPTCGGTEFSYDSLASDDDLVQVKCTTCNLTTTKHDLIAANGENIDAQLDEIKAEVLNDLTKSLRSAFKGN
jgi:predicted nucleic-acid-binding Zn-ribbon protein